LIKIARNKKRGEKDREEEAGKAIKNKQQKPSTLALSKPVKSAFKSKSTTSHKPKVVFVEDKAKNFAAVSSRRGN
jgi:hypothetical protein